jgi:RHS repeat-associated protein
MTPPTISAPHAISDDHSRQVWSWAHEPFGDTQPISSSGFAYDMRFPGQVADSESGLSNNMFRDYNSELGRYTKSDPIGLAAGVNTYGYVGQDPIMATDRLGLGPEEILVAPLLCALNPICRAGAIILGQRVASNFVLSNTVALQSAPLFIAATNENNPAYVATGLMCGAVKGALPEGLIATTAPDTLLSLGGQTAQTIDMTRVSAGNGNNLTIKAGGAALGGTNGSGGSLILSPGTSTGSGSSGITFDVYGPGSPGTADGSPTVAMTLTPSTQLGIQTASPDGILSLGGTVNQTVDMVRGTNSNPGKNLTVHAGGAASGGSNLNGGNLILGSGVSTGTGSSQIQFQIYNAGSSGTADNSPTTAMTIGGPGAAAGGLGIATTSPQSLLHVYNGEVQVGSSGASCTAANNGAIRFSGSTLYYCTGTTWTVIGSGGGGGTRPTFSVNKNGTNQTVTASTWTKLTWSNVVFDSNNNFASSTYTPTVAGKYMITASMRCNDNTSYCPVAIYKNGSEYAEGTLPATVGAPVTSSVTSIIDMNGSTDYGTHPLEAALRIK